MIKRILDKRTIITYFVICLLLTVVTREAGSAADILGGFTPEQGGRLNVTEIMRWNLGMLPPVAAGILFMGEELGAMRYFTLPRSKTVGRWCLLRFAAIGTANLAYLLMAEAVSVLCAMMEAGLSGKTVKNTVGNVNVGEGRYFVIFLMVFFVHSFMMSAVSAALLAWKSRPQDPLLFFLAVEGFLTAAGNLFPRTSAYLPPYWGMARQACFWAEDGRIYFLWTTGIQVALAIAAVRYVTVSLRGRPEKGQWKKDRSVRRQKKEKWKK